MTRIVKIGPVEVGGGNRFVLIAGPCMIETETLVMETCAQLKDICSRLDIPFIYKSSFDKANRTSINSFRGVGIQKGLEILRKVKNRFDVPVVTDVHEPWQCAEVAKVVDMIQIPAFLCRQTDLILAAGETGLPIIIKKGQFLAPQDMRNVIKKIESTGNLSSLLCERGTSFGYNNLVVDMTGMYEMRKFEYPVIFDVTHSVQKPGGLRESTGGNQEYAELLMYAGLAIGIDGVFAEVYPNPDEALSDGPNQFKLSSLERVLAKAKQIDILAKDDG